MDESAQQFEVQHCPEHIMINTVGTWEESLAENYYGIQDVRKIEAVGLDIDGADVNAIMTDSLSALEEMELD